MPLACMDNNGDIELLIFSKNQNFWFDKKVYDYLESIPEAERENMKKLARLNSLKREVAALEDEISNTNQ